MSRPSDISPWSLAQYLTGRTTPSERNTVDAYRVDNPKFAKAVSTVQHIFSRLNATDFISETDRTVAWNSLQSQLHHIPQPSSARKTGRNSLYAVYAAVAMTCLVILVGQYIQRDTPVVHHYATRASQRAMIDLADGSRIMLGPQSQLSIVESMTERAIAAQLSGEARFEIQPKNERAFTVHTKSIVTRVLGTEFIVRRYPADSITIVGVRSGKVSVGTSQDDTTLTAGNIGYFNDSVLITLQTSAPDKIESLVDDRIAFVNRPVTVILRELGRWYGYKFQSTDTTMLARRATVTFRINDKSEVFRLLQDLLDVTIVIQDSTVILHPRPTHFRQEVDGQTYFPRLRKETPTMIAPNRTVGR